MMVRVGALLNLLALVCIVVAAVRDRTEPRVVFGALDREGAVISQPNLLPWLIAAAALVALGTALMLRLTARGRPGTIAR
jgi:hypothetical protein